MTAQQKQRAELIKKKQADLYQWYTFALKQKRIKRNTLIETLMDESYHNQRQRQLARLCALYDITPDREQAAKNYSNSIAKANLVTGQPIFTYYKKGYLFELGHGVTLNKDDKMQIESEKTNQLIQKARDVIEQALEESPKTSYQKSSLAYMMKKFNI